jgi:acyl-CoA synthetase
MISWLIGVTAQNAYGMTHSCQCTQPGDSTDVIETTCGRPAEGTDIEVWQEANPDEEVQPHQTGELGVRGASLMFGCSGDQASTESSLNGQGWFMTGDLARIDERGNLQIVGRKIRTLSFAAGTTSTQQRSRTSRCGATP